MDSGKSLKHAKRKKILKVLSGKADFVFALGSNKTTAYVDDSESQRERDIRIATIKIPVPANEIRRALIRV